VVTIDLPPLCERQEDIPALVEHLLATRPQGPGPWTVHPDALRALEHYHWPGNVRELANVLERAQILAEGQVITVDDLPEVLRLPAPRPAAAAEPETLNLDVLEQRAVQAGLTRAQGNKVQAARLLGVSRRTLNRLIDKYRLEGPPPAPTADG
jgi:two-component system response regulator AtoC